MPKSLNGIEVLFPDFDSPMKTFKNIRDESDLVSLPELALPVCELKDFLYHSDELCDASLLESLRYLIEKFAESLVLQGRLLLLNLEDHSRFSDKSRKTISKINNSGRFRVQVKATQSAVRFPVIATVIYDSETNRYYIRFGCSPDIDQALSRTLLEFLGHWEAPKSHRSLLGIENLFVPIIPYEIVNKIENQLELHKPRVGFFPEYIHSFEKVDEIDGFSDVPLADSEATDFLLSFLYRNGYRCYVGEPTTSLSGHQIFIPEFFSQFKTSNADIWRIREVYHVVHEEILPSLASLSFGGIREPQYRNIKEKASEDLAFLLYLSQILMRRQVRFDGIPTPTLAAFYFLLSLEMHLNLHEEALDTANIILMAAEDIAPETEKTISNISMFLSFLLDGATKDESLELIKPFLGEDELDSLKSITAFSGMLLA